jgi:putative endonuclease
MKKGKLYEEKAANYLISSGFKTVATNYHSRWGEIDIIAEKNGTLYVIEVKGGKYIQNLHERIGCRKIKRIVKTLYTFLSKYPQYSKAEILFSAILVDKKGKIEMVPFSPDECMEDF